MIATINNQMVIPLKKNIKDRFPKLLMGLFLLFASTFPSTLYAQNDKHSPATVVMGDRSFTIPIPEDFCNETDHLFGKLMLQTLASITEQTGGIVNPKVIVKKCEMKDLHPWGYVSIGPDIGMILTQDQLNQMLATQLGNTALVDSIQGILKDSIEDDLGVELKNFSLGTPKILLSDQYASIYIANINTVVNGVQKTQLSIGSSTILKDRVIEYYIYILPEDETNSIQDVIKILHDNAMKLQALNSNS